MRLTGSNLVLSEDLAAVRSTLFSSNLTLLLGEFGHPELTEQFHNEFDEICREHDDPESIGLLSSLTFHDKPRQLPHGGMPWDFLSGMLALPHMSGRHDELESSITRYLRVALAEKIAAEVTKFSTLLASPGQLDLSISDDGAINLSNGEKDISYNFQAMGESTVLYFATMVALREILDVHLPLVISIDLHLDHLLQRPCLELIRKNSEQVIILERKHIREHVEEDTPTYRIYCDSGLGWGLAPF